MDLKGIKLLKIKVPLENPTEIGTMRLILTKVFKET